MFKNVVFVHGKRFSGVEWFIEHAVKCTNGMEISPNAAFNHDICHKHGLDPKRLSEPNYQLLLHKEYQKYGNSFGNHYYEDRTVELLLTEDIERYVFVDISKIGCIYYYEDKLKDKFRLKRSLVNVYTSYELRKQRALEHNVNVDDGYESDYNEGGFSFNTENATPSDVASFMKYWPPKHNVNVVNSWLVNFSKSICPE